MCFLFFCSSLHMYGGERRIWKVPALWGTHAGELLKQPPGKPRPSEYKREAGGICIFSPLDYLDALPLLYYAIYYHSTTPLHIQPPREYHHESKQAKNSPQKEPPCYATISVFFNICEKHNSFENTEAETAIRKVEQVSNVFKWIFCHIIDKQPASAV